MQDAVHTIQLLVAPVVMVSACGLLCLALYNRLAVIVGRIRTLNKEELDALLRAPSGSAEGAVAERVSARVKIVEAQVKHLLGRARLVRASLMCLLTVVLAMMLCSLSIGIALLLPVFAAVALGCFLAGVCVGIAGVITAMLELRVSLVAAALEDESIEPSA